MKEKIKRGIDNFLKTLKKPEMRILPGHLAFSLVLSIVPTITIITYIASVLKMDSSFIKDFIVNVFSEDFANLLFGTSMTYEVNFDFFLTLIVAYFIASNGAESIITSSNMIYGIENDNIIKRRIKAFIMILLIILLFVFLLCFNVFGNKIIEMFGLMNLSKKVLTNITLLISVLKGPFSWFIIFLFIKLIFTMAPDKKIQSKEVNKGAIFTTIGFILVTYFYSMYATRIARYNVFYGNLANIVVLMIWFYLLSYIITIGLALNYREEVITLEKTAKLENLETIPKEKTKK